MVSVQLVVGVGYIPLAPLSTMALSVLGSLSYSSRGWGLQLQSEETLVFAKTLKLVLLHINTVPPCQVQKVSQPLFEYCPGPSGFSLVAVSMCLGFWSRQVRLSRLAVTTWLWLEHNPPLVHPFTIACWTVALRFFSLRMSLPSSGWLVLL